MKYHSYSPTLAKLHGKKPSKVDRLIQFRSELTHTEIQFSDRYGGISFSATMADECKCARFKMISYSHPERWLTTALCVSDEQEDAVFKKCCEMAGIDKDAEVQMMIEYAHGDAEYFQMCYFGPNALKYDLAQVSLGFVSKLRIWTGHKLKVFCTESCFIALMEVWPEMLQFGTSDYTTYTIDMSNSDVKTECYLKRLLPDELSPSTGDMIIRGLARRMG